MPVIKIKEGYDVKPEGLYVLKVSKIESRVAERGPSAGSSFLSWEDIIVESPDHPELIGEVYTHATPAGCSPKSKYYKLFQSLGVSIPEGQKEIEFDTDDLIGREFVAEITIVKVNEQERNEFKNIWSIEEFEEHQRKATKLFSRKVSSLNPNTPSTSTSTNAKPLDNQQRKSVLSFPQ